jgi:hypothetical protein
MNAWLPDDQVRPLWIRREPEYDEVQRQRHELCKEWGRRRFRSATSPEYNTLLRRFRREPDLVDERRLEKQCPEGRWLRRMV